MKTSELIEALQKILDEKGDLEVCIVDDLYAHTHPITKIKENEDVIVLDF